MLLRHVRFGAVMVGVLAFLLLMAATQMSSAQESRAGTAIEPRATSDVSFNCYIPSLGSGYQCGRRFFVEAGRTLKVHLGTSGGKRVDFRAKDADTDNQIGQTAYVFPGQTKTLWTNRSGRSQYVYVDAGSPAIVAVRAYGEYRR